MILRKLDHSFYADNSHLVEALDLYNGKWPQGKTRGYGVVVIQINSLTFAIPLRTSIKHRAAYFTVHGEQKGLDFSKALYISNQQYISSESFKIPASEHSRLTGKAHFIAKKFEKYVETYIQAAKANNQNILSRKEYRHSTLINYHRELGL